MSSGTHCWGYLYDILACKHFFKVRRFLRRQNVKRSFSFQRLDFKFCMLHETLQTGMNIQTCEKRAVKTRQHGWENQILLNHTCPCRNVFWCKTKIANRSVEFKYHFCPLEEKILITFLNNSIVKSLQLIWRSFNHKFNLRMFDLQIDYREIILR